MQCISTVLHFQVTKNNNKNWQQRSRWFLNQNLLFSSNTQAIHFFLLNQCCGDLLLLIMWLLPVTRRGGWRWRECMPTFQHRRENAEPWKDKKTGHPNRMDTMLRLCARCIKIAPLSYVVDRERQREREKLECILSSEEYKSVSCDIFENKCTMKKKTWIDPFWWSFLVDVWVKHVSKLGDCVCAHACVCVCVCVCVSFKLVLVSLKSPNIVPALIVL